MAITYYWQDAWNYICRQVGRNIEDAHAAVICNNALNTMWQAYDWKESIATLPPFYLIPFEQDYGPPIFAVPTDFHGLRMAYRTQTTTVPPLKVELQIINNLRATGFCGLPASIGFNKPTQTIRVFPRVPQGMGATDWIVEGEYKKRPTKIVSATMQSTPLPFDDVYFHTQAAVLRFTALEASGDARADRARGIAMMEIDEMASNEGLNFGDSAISPRESMWDRSFTSGYGGPWI